MSKKRVAYFYDEDVGNFHYGEFLFGVNKLSNEHDSKHVNVL